ncbi:elongation of very long chain fatty acids protein 4-like isoform X2 [Diaphorina citri]|uniref:Elongation of very long chain fatty acids protein n=1 Tax=Diaphorina citri TaxID=121845 RepID=A0A3Q0IXM9_DIACI|nr:elongation of very long chain fatty acids protein 4-like isoform X2 [Diaphorina citri]
MLSEMIMSRIEMLKNDIVEDEEVDSRFFMSSWVPVTVTLVAYLVFVLYIGPKWMATRKPFQINRILMVYNLGQTLASLYVVSSFMYNAYIYVLIKTVDLLDTVFFVLKKKQSHITFLHVYHHAAMLLTSWAYLRFIKGEQVIFLGALNCLVHAIMYSYYFFASFGPKAQKYLWWKKYITKLQMTQFILIALHQWALILFNCKVPVLISYSIIAQNVLFVILFWNFYYKTYLKKSSRKKGI